MALEGEQSVVANHAAAVVSDADEAASAGFDFNADACGSGIEGVFEEFFHDRGGAVDDFASGDLIGDLVGENADAAHAGFKNTRSQFSLNREHPSGHVLQFQRIPDKKLFGGSSLEQCVIGAHEVHA